MELQKRIRETLFRLKHPDRRILRFPVEEVNQLPTPTVPRVIDLGRERERRRPNSPEPVV